jgi:hypothetical protein
MNREADKIVRMSIKKAGLENPGKDFLQSVMSKIETQTEVAPVRIKNEALISRNGWLLIGGIVTLLLGTVLLTDSDYKIPFVISFKTEMLHDYFSIFESRIFVVSIVITAIFVLLHTWLISRKMDDWYLRYKHQM